MKIFSLLGKYFLNVYQTFPQLIPFFGIYYGLITVNYWLLAFGISAIFSNASNKMIKILIEQLYKLSGKTTIPILGLGGRPKDAKNCSAFTDCETCNIRPTSFGMPSGHSQMGWFFFCYGTLFLAENVLKNLKDTKNKKTKSIIWFSIVTTLLFIMAVTLSYSRVHIKCHTVQQVVLGGFIGIGFGILSYYISHLIINGSNITFYQDLIELFS